MKIKNVIFDFNGTLINDVDLCIEMLNEMLLKKNHPAISKNRYLEIFTFPIIKYYEASGFIFPEDNFDELAKFFIKEYRIRAKNCKLYDSVIPTLKKLLEHNINLYIISASEINLLKHQVEEYGIEPYFQKIIGIESIKAPGKDQAALEFMKSEKLNKDETIFIGDTLHDEEVGDKIGVQTILISEGHQSNNLLKSRSHSLVFPSLNDFVPYLIKNNRL